MSHPKPKKQKSRKVLWITIVAVLAGAGWMWSRWSKTPEIVVQTSKVTRQDITSIVTASGEIKPLNWVNISATAYGQLTAIRVKEGDRVKKGQELANLESVQPRADVNMQKAQLASAEADVLGAAASALSVEATFRTAQADLLRAQAEVEKARAEFGRIEALHKERLASRSDYDTSRAAARVAEAAVARAKAMTMQTRAQADQAMAQLGSARRRVEQMRAGVDRATNALTKTSFVAPLDGIVTSLPVHVGENVVMGIQNSPGSSLMTIADMSVITAEVKVDETDIVNVRLGQTAEVSIDAFPDKKFTGKVTEIGNSAIVRSTGLVTTLSGSSSQEAKDFKVVVTLDSPPDNLRPGFSTTARIQTQTRKSVLSLPIQAITIRKRGDLVADVPRKDQASQPIERTKSALDKTEIQGIFVVRKGRAEFTQIKTGITGVTDIEIEGGVGEGEEVVTGSYKVLHTLKNRAAVKPDNDVVEKGATELEEGA